MINSVLPLGSLIKPAALRRAGSREFPILSMTMHRGLVDQGDKFKKRVASQDTSTYKIVGRGQLVVGFPIDEGVLSFQVKYDEAIVSPAYDIWDISDPERIDREYLERFLKSPKALAYYAAKLRGTTARRRSLPKDVFLELPVVVPDDPRRQRKIVRWLNHVDALRAKRCETIALLDGLTQSVFVDMFGDPVSNPMGLPLARLTDLGTLDRGVSKHRPRNDPKLLGGIYPLIQTGDVARSQGYIRAYESTYSDMGLAQSRLWPSGTLCITIAANIAKTGILQFDACFPDSVVGFTSDAATVEYVQTWLSFLQENLERMAPESAQKNINLATLRGLSIPNPGTDLVEEFASRIGVVGKLRATASAHLAELDALFASLQHRAFERKVRAEGPVPAT
ncbi:restriction endonuclease subunit S [Streptomyces sp. x-80]|jgi:type I restriction enzyme S subunit|uniref:restriction endonuclease subunit S n=1 Tax=Streptomyces sp. x-80 TaxID=2789282 RepID=UPI0039815B9F